MRTLRFGSYGSDVKTLQELLNKKFQPTPALVPDSSYGRKTKEVVKAYQKSSGLSDDGVVGPKTWKALGSSRVGAAFQNIMAAEVVSVRQVVAEVQGALARENRDRITDGEFCELSRELRTSTNISDLQRSLITQRIVNYYKTLKGPFIRKNVDALKGKPLVGSGQCAAIVQYKLFDTGRIGYTKAWRQGASVKGNFNLARGTAIATFVDGKYPNKSHGNHVALYLSQNSSGIQVMDQWSTSKSQKVGSRTLPFQGKKPNGLFKDSSNNGDAFSVIRSQ